MGGAISMVLFNNFTHFLNCSEFSQRSSLFCFRVDWWPVAFVIGMLLANLTGISAIVIYLLPKVGSFRGVCNDADNEQLAVPEMEWFGLMGLVFAD